MEAAKADQEQTGKLLFKHLPRDITQDDCSDFLVSLGATSVHYFGIKGPFRNCATAEFPSVEHAWKIIRATHQQPILGRRLCVEFFTPSMPFQPPIDAENATCHCTKSSRGSDQSSPIAPKWNILKPFSSKLHYTYPVVTANILTNIVRCMVSCPAFYTQVLHIMNKLHLPPPFGDSDLFPGNLRVVCEKVSSINTSKLEPSKILKEDFSQEEQMDLSGTSESEISSDEERPEPVILPRNPPTVKRKRTAFPRKDLIAPHRTAFNTNPETDTIHAANLSDVFEAPSHSSKLSLHIPQSLRKVNPPKERVGGFGVLHAPSASLVENLDKRESTEKDSPNPVEDDFELRKYSLADIRLPDEVTSETDSAGHDTSEVMQSFSLNDLKLRRLTNEERQNYAVFSRNYSPGDPTSRLYIKNLSPSVTEEDLYRIFGAFQYGPIKDLDFSPTVSCVPTQRFSIRLLTSGRMKGQAFVSLSCETTAAQALEATNGLLLYDKPMVVQFARGAKAKVDEKSLLVTHDETRCS